jgi:hypothetical protein
MPVVTEQEPAGRRRGGYPKEFRRDVAALVIDQRPTVAYVSISSNRPCTTGSARSGSNAANAPARRARTARRSPGCGRT